jgi:hypothetical protein
MHPEAIVRHRAVRLISGGRYHADRPCRTRRRLPLRPAEDPDGFSARIAAGARHPQPPRAGDSQPLARSRAGRIHPERSSR